MAQDIQINIGQYISDKALGVTRLVKLNGQPFYSTKEFNRTGLASVLNVPIAPEAVKDMITNLQKEIADKQAVLASVQQVLVDMDTAPELLATAGT